MLSAICFNLDKSKILLSGNGLKKSTFENTVKKGENIGDQIHVYFSDNIFYLIQDKLTLLMTQL